MILCGLNELKQFVVSGFVFEMGKIFNCITFQYLNLLQNVW